MKKKIKNQKMKSLWEEFKKFISRGNVVDMAVAVVIGGAFSAIVKALTDILLSICTWGVPGGLTGLITVLPAINSGQRAPDGYKSVYTATEFLSKDFNASETAMYVQHGQQYYYKGLAIIDWGAFINAIITFLIIALTLFVILKVFNNLKNKRKAIEDKIKEEYYKKHPEERPKEEVVVKPITELDVLKDIKDIMKSQGQVKKHPTRKIKY